MSISPEKNRPLFSGIIYNVTTKTDPDIHQAWLAWMQDEHIPAILGTGCFERHRIVRLLETDDTDGPTYAVQYEAPTLQHYRQYASVYGPQMQKAIREKWGNQCLSFSSLMGIVQ